MKQEPLLIGGVLLALVALAGGFAYVGTRPAKPVEDVTTTCVQHGNLVMHDHAHLEITIDGTKQKIPANVGVVNPSCFRPVHTHDEGGEIHTEFPTRQDVFLRDFFRVWEKPLSRQAILDRTISEQDTLSVTVNGHETPELENLPLHDGDHIVLTVKKKDK